MLREAAAKGDVASVRELLAQGVDVDDTEESEYGTPLSAAARAGQLEIVTLLLDAGANIDFRNEDMGATPLMMAVDAGQVEVVKHLIARGADINARNVDGANALLYAQGAPAPVREEILRLLRQGRG
jgi:ankyrin repeat protein